MNDKEKITQHTKIGSRSYNNVKNPELVIQGLLDEDSTKRLLEKFYKVDSKGDSEIFLEEIGRKKGFLIKGNKVDLDRTSRLILKVESQSSLV